MRQIGHWAASVVAVLLLGPAFWLAATHGSNLAAILAMTINVHGLAASGYDGNFGRTMAPLSQRILADARYDAGSLSAPRPSPAMPPSSLAAAPLGTARPSASPGLISPVVPRPSSMAVPLPTPTAPPLPTPSGVPLPTPTRVPLPTPGGLPLPTPSGVPLPTPSGLPLPTPTGLPVPTLPALPVSTLPALPVPIPSPPRLPLP